MISKQLIISQRETKKATGLRLPPITKQPIAQPSGKTLEVSYFRAISKLIEPYFQSIRERLVPKIPEIVQTFKSQTKVDDTYGTIITKKINDISIGIALDIPEFLLKRNTAIAADRINKFQRNGFDRQIRTVLGVNPILTEPYLIPQIEAFVERNVALIKDIPEASLKKIETKLRAGIEQGFSSKRLQEIVIDELGVAKNRAKLIARDQTNKFMGKLIELRQTELGVEEYVWSTAGDERVRPTHKSKDGKTFKWNKPPTDTGHPGQDINCFPGDSLVVPTAPINRLYRRFYRGELTGIITEKSGRAVCTPNHPVFTDSGWKAMKNIKVGDNIANVNFESPQIFNRDTQDGQTKFVELFDSFSMMFAIESATTMQGDFHGDTVVDQTIDIINIGGGLMDTLKPDHFKCLNQEVFTRAINDALLGIESSGFGSFNLAAFRSFTSSSSIISLARKLLFLRFSEFTEADKVSLTTIADRYVVAMKAISKHTPCVSEFFGKMEDRTAIQILLDKNILIKMLRIMCFSVMTNNLMTSESHFNAEITGSDIEFSSDLAKILPSDISGYSRVNEINSEFYSGHTYNLQTFNGWYGSTTTTGEQLIFSNCRCRAIGIMDELKPGRNIPRPTIAIAKPSTIVQKKQIKEIKDPVGYLKFQEDLKLKYKGESIFAQATDLELEKLEILEKKHFISITPPEIKPAKNINKTIGEISNKWELNNNDRKELKDIIPNVFKLNPQDETLIELHPVKDKKKYQNLTKQMNKKGWQGRPIIVMDTPDGRRALTGSHRIAAARKAGVEIPVYNIENEAIERWFNKNKSSTIDDFILGDDRDRLKNIEKTGDKLAIKLMELELN